MSATHGSTTRSALANKVDDLVNTGSGTAKVRARDGSSTIVDFDLSDPAFGDASGPTITLNDTPIDGAAGADGDLDNFQILDKNGTMVVAGSITGSGGGGDIEVSNTNIATGQASTLDSLTYTASP